MSENPNTSEIALLPFVCGAGARRQGCVESALDLKKRGLHDQLTKAGIPAAWLEDPETVYNSEYGRIAYENLPALGSPARHDLVLWHCSHLAGLVRQAITEGKLPVTLGGDHAMAAGSIAGLARAKKAHGRIGLLWVDAHPDLNTWETTPSQSLHGMPLAALLGMGDKDMRLLSGSEPVLKPEHLFLLGIRDIDPGERETIDRLNIPHLLMEDVERMGLASAFDLALETLGGVDHLAMSLDLDGLDPEDAPAVGSPVPGGIRKEELLKVFERIGKTEKLSLVEIAEYNSTLPGADKTCRLIGDLLKALLKR